MPGAFNGCPHGRHARMQSTTSKQVKETYYTSKRDLTQCIHVRPIWREGANYVTTHSPTGVPAAMRGLPQARMSTRICASEPRCTCVRNTATSRICWLFSMSVLQLAASTCWKLSLYCGGRPGTRYPKACCPVARAHGVRIKAAAPPRARGGHNELTWYAWWRLHSGYSLQTPAPQCQRQLACLPRTARA